MSVLHRGVSQSLLWVMARRCRLFVTRLIMNKQDSITSRVSPSTNTEHRHRFPTATDFWASHEFWLAQVIGRCDKCISAVPWLIAPINRCRTISIFLVRSNGTRPCNGNFLFKLSAVGPKLTRACCRSPGTNIKDEGDSFYRLIWFEGFMRTLF